MSTERRWPPIAFLILLVLTLLLLSFLLSRCQGSAPVPNVANTAGEATTTPPTAPQSGADRDVAAGPERAETGTTAPSALAPPPEMTALTSPSPDHDAAATTSEGQISDETAAAPAETASDAATISTPPSPDRDAAATTSEGQVNDETAAAPAETASDAATISTPPGPGHDAAAIAGEKQTGPAGEPGATASAAGQGLSGLERAVAAAGASGAPARPVDIVLQGVEFLTNSAELTPASHAALDQVAAVLKRHPALRVEVAGYTDSTGSAERNRALSQARAEAVRDYLVRQGIDPARLTARGYGPASPIADNATAAGRQRNRRVELHVLP